MAECGIEFIVRKRSPEEIARRGRLLANTSPSREVRVHLNQYRDDVATLKAANTKHPPFENDRDL